MRPSDCVPATVSQRPCPSDCVPATVSQRLCPGGKMARAPARAQADRKADSLSVTVVPAAGLEPARPKPRDFKSRASTNFAKRALPRKCSSARERSVVALPQSPLAGVQTGPQSPLAGVHTGPQSPLAGVHTGPQSPLAGVHTGPQSPLAGVHTGPQSPLAGVHTGPPSSLADLHMGPQSSLADLPAVRSIRLRIAWRFPAANVATRGMAYSLPAQRIFLIARLGSCKSQR